MEIPSELQLADSLVDLLEAVNPTLKVLDFLHLCLRLLGMLPEIGHVGAQLFLFELYAAVVDVEIAAKRVAALTGFLKLFLCDHSGVFLFRLQS